MSENQITELDRINREFARRDADPKLAGRYSLFNPAALLHRQGQERLSLAFLKKYRLENLAGLKILDAGCGSGGQCAACSTMGPTPPGFTGLICRPAALSKPKN